MFKRWETNHGIEAKKLKVATLGLLSLTASTLDNYFSTHPERLHAVLNHASAIGFVAVLMYHFGGANTFDKLSQLFQDINNYVITGQLPGGNPKS